MPALEGESKRCFVDTNIWLYAFIESDAPRKREIAKAIVSHVGVVVSSQVISETSVNLLKKGLLSEAEIRQLVAAFYERYAVMDVDRNVLLTASELRERYSLSYWDSLIVAGALCAGCEVLYTEDMQDGLVVAGELHIVNPFRAE
jgi:predicted nucleic acid-binding protein